MTLAPGQTPLSGRLQAAGCHINPRHLAMHPAKKPTNSN
jgi:hypothetical protein